MLSPAFGKGMQFMSGYPYAVTEYLTSSSGILNHLIMMNKPKLDHGGRQEDIANLNVLIASLPKGRALKMGEVSKR